MKKTILIYVAILVAVFILFSFLDRGSDYAIEQKLWRINKLYADVEKDPAVVPDRTFDRLVQQYKNVIEKYPESNVIRGVYLLLSQVHVLKEDFSSSREVLDEIIEKYPEDPELVAEAMSRKGKTYELQQNWPKANEIYQDVIVRYPLTNVGLATPIYVASYYRQENDFENTMKSYEQAISFYKNIAEKNKGEAVGLYAKRFLANCYLDQNRWRDAVDALGDILFVYAQSDLLDAKKADSIIKTINMIAAFQIKDFTVATGLYQRFVDQFPGHPMSVYLNKMIEAFNKLEAQQNASAAGEAEQKNEPSK